MSEFKGSKGPWFFNGREIESVECAYIADVNGTNASQDEECCNAHLIAAAPDLLEALQYIVDPLINDLPIHSMAYKQAVAAIAKALGETK